MRRNVLFILVLLCVSISTTEAGLQKCGFLADRCILLADGSIFWPKDYNIQCNWTPICPREYKLHKQFIGKVHACCCLLRNIHQCPDCDMSLNNINSYYQWIERNLKRNGPPDGKCPNGKLKRIFFGGPGKLDKCCCEPKDSLFAHKYSAV